MGKKVLIATIFHSEPVLLSAMKFGPEKIILLTSKDQTTEQEKSIELIQESLGKVVDIKISKIEVYDIVEVSKKVVEIIDSENVDTEIYVNITSGRKTQAIGLLFAAYARSNRIKKIAYLSEETKSIIYLPKLSFKLTDSQKKILEEINKKNYSSTGELANKIKLSTAMLYRAIDELKDMDFISTDDGIKLTDAGRIAQL